MKDWSIRLSDEEITQKNFLIRGEKIMLDRDLALLYGVKAIRLREQVKRNLSRFPENFMFWLTDSEVDFMVSQNAIPSKKHLGGFLPLGFTEHGVLMLANVLKSELAIRMSIKIIEVFVKMREVLNTHKDILLKLEAIEKKLLQHDHHLKKHEDEIQLIFKALKQLLNTPNPPRTAIGYRQKKSA